MYVLIINHYMTSTFGILDDTLPKYFLQLKITAIIESVSMIAVKQIDRRIYKIVEKDLLFLVQVCYIS